MRGAFSRLTISWILGSTPILPSCSTPNSGDGNQKSKVCGAQITVKPNRPLTYDLLWNVRGLPKNCSPLVLSSPVATTVAPDSRGPVSVVELPLRTERGAQLKGTCGRATASCEFLVPLPNLPIVHDGWLWCTGTPCRAGLKVVGDSLSAFADCLEFPIHSDGSQPPSTGVTAEIMDPIPLVAFVGNLTVAKVMTESADERQLASVGVRLSVGATRCEGSIPVTTKVNYWFRSKFTGYVRNKDSWPWSDEPSGKPTAMFVVGQDGPDFRGSGQALMKDVSLIAQVSLVDRVVHCGSYTRTDTQRYVNVTYNAQDAHVTVFNVKRKNVFAKRMFRSGSGCETTYMVSADTQISATASPGGNLFNQAKVNEWLDGLLK